MQNPTALTAYFQGKQLLLFSFAMWRWCPLHELILTDLLSVRHCLLRVRHKH